jgi:hypothetical protein
MFMRHLWQLLKDLFAFAWKKKVWWIVPVVLAMLILAALIVIGEVSAPFIYTLF